MCPHLGLREVGCVHTSGGRASEREKILIRDRRLKIFHNSHVLFLEDLRESTSHYIFICSFYILGYLRVGCVFYSPFAP